MTIKLIPASVELTCLVCKKVERDPPIAECVGGATSHLWREVKPLESQYLPDREHICPDCWKAIERERPS